MKIRFRSFVALLLGCAVLFAIIAYLDFRSFKVDTLSYSGITFGDTREAILDRFGSPDFVLAPAATSEPQTSRSSDARSWVRFYYARSEIPPNKKVEDYNEWGFNASDDRAELTIEFEPQAGRVNRITCAAINTGVGKHCSSLFGIRIGDTEPSILRKLGKPDSQKFYGATKTLEYADVGVDFTLGKQDVYRISSFSPKGDTNAIRRRYLQARLWGVF
jgi:hypothetical protein